MKLEAEKDSVIGCDPNKCYHITDFILLYYFLWK